MWWDSREETEKNWVERGERDRHKTKRWELDSIHPNHNKAISTDSIIEILTQ